MQMASRIHCGVLLVLLMGYASAGCPCYNIPGSYCQLGGSSCPFKGTCHGQPSLHCSCHDCGEDVNGKPVPMCKPCGPPKPPHPKPPHPKPPKPEKGCVYGGLTPTTPAVPPPQYPSQIEVVQNWTAIAKQKSANASQPLLEILDTVALRQMLNRTCPRLYHDSAQQLMDRILEEMTVSELMHTFESNCNNQGDTSLAMAVAGDYFYSIWQVYFLNISRGYRFPENILNLAEVGVFKLPPFKPLNSTHPISWVDRFPHSFEDAGSRLIYTALNYEKVPGPNNGYGDITLIMNRTNVRNMTVISPMDTGAFCHKSGPPKPVCHGYVAEKSQYEPKVDGCYVRRATPVNGFASYIHTKYKWIMFYEPNTTSIGRWVISLRPDNVTSGARCFGECANGTLGPGAVKAEQWYSLYEGKYVRERKMRVVKTKTESKKPPRPKTSTPDCAAWDRSLGTLDHLTHLIVDKYKMSWGNSTYNSTTNRSSHIYPTLDCNPEYNGQTRIHGWPFSYPYFEANVLGNAIYPYGVQAVVVSFTAMFGTSTGDVARAWCIKHGWPLFWSYDARSTGSDLALKTNFRLIDPDVLRVSRVGHNYTVRQNDSVAWDTLLAEAKAIARNSTTKRPSASEYSKWWLILSHGNASYPPNRHSNVTHPPTTLVAQPLSAYQCARPEKCVGVTQANLTCLCVD